jgi:hypothetical protein
LITDHAGTPVGYDLKPANENEREGVFQLASAHPGTVLSPKPGIAAASTTTASNSSVSS